MQFTEAEVQFLIRPHRVETADRNPGRVLAETVDMRALGCPAHIFERVLESRAQRLGAKFVEFRNAQRVAAIAPTPDLDLDARVAASKLF